MRGLPAGVFALMASGLLLGRAAEAQTESRSATAGAARKGVAMAKASGPFDVKIEPQATDDKGEGISLGRLSLQKQYRGDLAGQASGQMLTGGTGVKGSAAYVAIEWVSGTLHGRRGGFLLQHRGTMTRGEPDLSVAVVPDSGTGELVGLAGSMTIHIAPDGKHSYELEYTLPEKP